MASTRNESTMTKAALSKQLNLVNDIPVFRLTIDGMESPEFEVFQSDICLDLYERISAGVPLKIDSAYIYGFSIKNYKRIYGISDEKIVEVIVDSFIDCCFMGHNGVALDFSGCRIIAYDPTAGIDLEGCYFCEGQIDLSYCDFGDFDLSFTNCTFYSSDVNFSQSIFRRGDLHLNDTNFCNTEGKIIMHGTVFQGGGQITFENMENSRYFVDFYRTDFGQRTLDASFLKCPMIEFSFFEVETSSMPINFVDSEVKMIIMYRSNINGLLDFRIAKAKHIILQDCIIRDCALLGNRGYNNMTSYCFKGSMIIGHVRIQNQFSKKLFAEQLQYAVDPKDDQIVLTPTTSVDKARQLVLLSENFHDDGESDKEDKSYALSKRYQNRGRVYEVWTDYAAVKNTDGYIENRLKRIGPYVTISFRLIVALLAYLTEKILLDIFCGEYATKPAKFLMWISILISGFGLLYYRFIGSFEIVGAMYEKMQPICVASLYSLQVFFQVEFGGVEPKTSWLFILVLLEKIIGLAVFSLFVVSYTRKVIK